LVPSKDYSSFVVSTGTREVHTQFHTVTVTVKNEHNQPVDVDPAQLSGTALPEGTVGQFARVIGQVGVYEANIYSDRAGYKTVAVSWSDGTLTVDVPASGTDQVLFHPGPAVEVLSTFAVTLGNRWPDGVAFHEAWVYFIDAYDNPRQGDVARFQMLNNAENDVAGSGAQIDSADSGTFYKDALSDASGRASVRIYSFVQHPAGKTGFPVRAVVDLSNSLTKYVPFSPDSAHPEHSTFEVTPAPPATRVADGVQSFAGKITLYDVHDLKVPGATTSLTICKVDGNACNATTDVTVTDPSGGPANWVASNPDAEVNLKFTSTKVGTYRLTARIGEDAIGAADPKYREITFSPGDPDAASSE
jgi:hypothetical protein